MIALVSSSMSLAYGGSALIRQCVSGKHALPTPPPEHQHPVALPRPQAACRFAEQPQDHRAIIIGERDEIRLHDKPAQLDQMQVESILANLSIDRGRRLGAELASTMASTSGADEAWNKLLGEGREAAALQQ